MRLSRGSSFVESRFATIISKLNESSFLVFPKSLDLESNRKSFRGSPLPNLANISVCLSGHQASSFPNVVPPLVSCRFMAASKETSGDYSAAKTALCFMVVMSGKTGAVVCKKRFRWHVCARAEQGREPERFYSSILSNTWRGPLQTKGAQKMGCGYSPAERFAATHARCASRRAMPGW